MSDIARLIIIYQYGGIYFDTDVEVIKSFDDILDNSKTGFMGFETTGYINTGLGFGSIPNNILLKELIDYYDTVSFEEHKENLSSIACPIVMDDFLKEKGFLATNSYQNIYNFDIYPSEFFSPIDYKSMKIYKTKNTHTIHWYNASWTDGIQKKEQGKLNRYCKIFGSSLGEKLYGITSCIKKEGIIPYIKKRIFRK